MRRKNKTFGNRTYCDISHLNFSRGWNFRSAMDGDFRVAEPTDVSVCEYFFSFWKQKTVSFRESKRFSRFVAKYSIECEESR